MKVSFAKNLFAMLIGVSILSPLQVRSMGIDVVKSEKVDLTIGGRAQLTAYAENVADPSRDNNRLYMFLRQARLNIHGRFDEVKFNTEWAFAAEDISTTNNDLTMLDFSFDIPFPGSQNTWIKVGQFKVPYSRERLAYSGNLQFAERSIQNLGFNHGRDVGVALHTQKDKLTGAFGIFTGGGRDIPLRFLPEVLGFPLAVLRAGYNDGVDKDIFNVVQNDLNIEKTQKAFFVNGFFTNDTLIGHDVVLDIKPDEKSYLINKNYNPFIARSPLDRGTLWQIGWDAVLRKPLSSALVWNGELEMNHGEFSNRYGTLRMTGGRVQTGFLFNKKFEVALRYAALLGDDTLAYNKTTAPTSTTSLDGKKVINEIAPALTFYLKGHDMKIVMDAPILINAPVAIENGIGAYVLTEQPNQVTYTAPASGRYSRQTVTQARLMFQIAF